MTVFKKSKLTSCLYLSLFVVAACSYSNIGNAATNILTSTNISTSAPKLTRVNLGGVYVLEDWFFSKNSVGHNVMTTCEEAKNGGVGSSQIFIGNAPVKQLADFTWTSETDLIKKLYNHGYTSYDIEKIFQSHRDEYLGKKVENNEIVFSTLQNAAKHGIKTIRMPISWAIQYDDKKTKPYIFNQLVNKKIVETVLQPDYSIKGNNGFETKIPASTDKVNLIQDPFYPDKQWASIPITQIEEILKAANKLGIKIILDVHTFPGGSSDGTYNGVWPDAPRFWTLSKTDYEANFRTIFDRLIAWASLLKETNPEAFAGLAGLTPMNEPAHLMGFLEISKNETVLAKKPVCNATDSSGKIISWGAQPKDILDTLSLAVEDFRVSILPNSGVKLIMNVIETMYNPTDYNPKDQTTYPFSLIGNWWLGITSSEDRKTWAAIDIHHYIAWDGGCNNVVTAKVLDLTENGQIKWNGPGYTNPVYKTDALGEIPMYMTRVKNNDGSLTFTIAPNGFEQMKACSAWFKNIRGELGITNTAEMVYASEFSVGTNANSWMSGSNGRALDGPSGWTSDSKSQKLMTITNTEAYRNAFIEEQVKNAHEANINAIFWTWYIQNNNFNDWSLSTICNSGHRPTVCGGI